MFNRLFKRGASATALCVNCEDAIDRTHEAGRRIAELESMLAAKIAELEALSALAASKPVKVAAAKKLATVKPAKVAKIAALEFWRMHGQAVAAITAKYGEAWKVVAPIGQTELAILATGYRSAKTERGTVLRWSKDARIPAAQFWPNGELPVGVTLEADYSRHDTIEAGKIWRARCMDGSQTVTATAHSAEWHLDHGYVQNSDGEWVSELGYRAWQMHQDAIAEAATRKQAAYDALMAEKVAADLATPDEARDAEDVRAEWDGEFERDELATVD